MAARRIARFSEKYIVGRFGLGRDRHSAGDGFFWQKCMAPRDEAMNGRPVLSQKVNN